ncbi:voltage-gated chloride channel family protein [Acetobacter thailandicus]|uniref:voltage-gated chloride channel family protein n=1 Tax=Acetobacter thailandicus TaxID=1502842 RepID=UPI001BA5BA94|nr:voltage-gated chloride channel family protein [Acetobacter thailandicus]MBS1003506.1 voltage-gated chloride channel family protein [Acetobacter thailandicus]
MSRFSLFQSSIVANVLSVLRWSGILLPMAVCVGTLCAVFLSALDHVTDYRFAHPGMLWFLPLAGVAVGLAYHWLGRSAEGGNNLIVDQIHEPGGGVPLRMAPLVLVATVISHLFGASVGREGTAVQIGGSIASGFARLFRLDDNSVRIILMAGIAAGFGAVFGTPVAGAVFAMEVLSIGSIDYRALVPIAAASILADIVCHAWGVHHATYKVAFVGYPDLSGQIFHTDPVLLLKVGVTSVCFGLTSLLFAESVHRLGPVFRQVCPIAWLRPAIGGVLTIMLVFIAGTQDYLGLGVVAATPGGASILNFFQPGDYTWSWLWKLVFTVVALSAGFKGGEVTPLFFIGAGLGHTLATLLGVPTDLLAAVGFVAVFAGAANTPLACTFMGVELFGATDVIYIATGCFIAYICSGHSGIYLSQRIGIPKSVNPHITTGMTLRQARGFIDQSVRKIDTQTSPETATQTGKHTGQ